jgi:hypothetical protein
MASDPSGRELLDSLDELLEYFQSRSKDDTDRWETFHVYTLGLYNDPHAAIEKHMEFLHTMANDDHERTLFRFQAASALSFIYAKCDEFDVAAEGFELAISLYQTLTSIQRKQKVKGVKLTATGDLDFAAQFSSNAKDVTVGAIMDKEMKLVKECLAFSKAELDKEERIERLGADEAFIQDITKKLGMSREAAEEFVEYSKSNEDRTLPVDGFATPLRVTSEMVEQVKQLSDESEETIFIEYEKEMEQFEKEPYYRIFSVDWQQFQDGKRNKIFDHTEMVVCTKSDTTAQHVVDIFAMISLQQKRPLSASESIHVAHRPKKVFLEATLDDATAAEIRSSLANMGCSDVGTIDARLKLLLKKTRAEVIRKSVAKRLDTKKYPHLKDRALKIKCGNCKKTGPQLKVCPCGKAYFCNQDCITARWKEHKPEHKLEMARKKKEECK